MPENLNDSPARLEENEEYQRDPYSTQGKPYSTKQLAANARHGQRETLYHNEHGRRVFMRDEVEDAKKDGWRDVPFVHPRHPENVIEIDDPEMKALVKEAQEMGIKVDKRWNKKRLISKMREAVDNE